MLFSKLKLPSYDVVLVTNGAGQLGGAERSIGELSIQFRARGDKVLMLADRILEKTTYSAFLEKGGVPVKWVDWHPDRSHWQNAKLAWRVFRSFRTSIILFNVSWRPRLWVIPIIARLASSTARLVGRVCAMPDPAKLIPRKIYLGLIPGLRLWTLRARFYSWVWGTMATRVVSVNREEFPRRMVTEYCFSPKQIRVIRNGVPPRQGVLKPKLRQMIREQAMIGVNEIFLLYAGRLDRGKGIEHLFQALHDLPEQYKLAVIGDGQNEESLRELAHNLCIQERVRMLGFKDNPRDWMAAADIVVMPAATGEGLNRVVIEALAERAPIIASAVSGVREIFQDKVHGLHFLAADVLDLSRAILTLGQDPQLRQRMAEAGYELYKSTYHVDRVREEYFALCHEMLDGR